jgi:phasin family protein
MMSIKIATTDMTKAAENFLSFGQNNIGAFVQSNQIWAAGMQAISKQIVATAQANFDETLAAFQAMTTVKTPKDALDIHTKLVRADLEKAMAEAGKLIDASQKLAEQAFAPIAAQMNAVADKFVKVV